MHTPFIVVGLCLAQAANLEIVGLRPERVDLRSPVGVQLSLTTQLPYPGNPGGVVTVTDGQSSCQVEVRGSGPLVCNWLPSQVGLRELRATWTTPRGPPVVSRGRTVEVVSNAASLERVSIPWNPAEPTQFHSRGTSELRGQALSFDGRWLVFVSDSPRLLPLQVSQTLPLQVFLKDQLSGAVRLVSSVSGALANAPAISPVISGDGRWVAFTSSATNLAGQSTGQLDVFLFDVATGLIRRAAPEGNGITLSPSLSHDGRWLAFVSTSTTLVPGAGGTPQVFLRDLVTGRTTVVSRSLSGAAAFGLEPFISSDASTVVFSSPAPDLVTGDTNSVNDVFAFRVSTNTVERISLRADGSQTTSESYSPAVSGDGTRVVFLTEEALVADDRNQTTDVYLYEPNARRGVRRVSLTTLGVESRGEATAPTISADGSLIGFAHNRDLVGGTDDGGVQSWAAYVVPASGPAAQLVEVSRTQWNTRALSTPAVSVSGNARFAGFSNDDPRVLPGSGPQSFEAYTRELSSGVVKKVSAQLGGHEAGDDSISPSMTRDGRVVAFTTYANNLAKDPLPLLRDQDTDIIVRDRLTGATRALASATRVRPHAPEISSLGRHVAYGRIPPSVQNQLPFGRNLFLRDLDTGGDVLVSRTLVGGLLTQNVNTWSLTEDGTRVVFDTADPWVIEADSNGFADVFEFTRTANGGVSVTLVSAAPGGSPANGASVEPSTSADGGVIAFSSDATNLVSGDVNQRRDIFVRRLGSITRVGQPVTGGANGDARRPRVSGNGRYVAFESAATNLGVSDSNGRVDVFVQDLVTGRITLVSRTAAGLPSNGTSHSPTISDDGQRIAFHSDATNLTTEPGLAVYVFDLPTRQVRRVRDPRIEQARRSPFIEGARLSGDGSTVVFASPEPLQVGDGNQASDIYVTASPW